MRSLSKEERRKRDTNVKVDDIKMSLISDNPYQSRKKYGGKDMKLLAKSITERGLMHPISVVKIGERYTLVSGHRRWRAFKVLHRKTIPAIIRRESTQEDLAIDLAIENAIRKDLSPIEKARDIFTLISTIKNVNGDVLRAYSLVTQVKLMKGRGIEKIHNKKGNANGLTEDDIWQCKKLLDMIGISENTAIKYLRMLDLPKFISDRIVAIQSNEKLSKEMLNQGYITVTMAYEISRIRKNKQRKEIYDKQIKYRWTSSQLRTIIDEMLESGEAEGISKLGTNKRRGTKDRGLEILTKRIYSLSEAMINFKYKIEVLPMCLNKIILRAALRRLQKGCIILLERSQDIMDNEADIYESYKEEKEFKVKFTDAGDRPNGVRFTIPAKKTREMGAKPGDHITIKILKIHKRK